MYICIACYCKNAHNNVKYIFVLPIVAMRLQHKAIWQDKTHTSRQRFRFSFSFSYICIAIMWWWCFNRCCAYWYVYEKSSGHKILDVQKKQALHNDAQKMNCTQTHTSSQHQNLMTLQAVISRSTFFYSLRQTV